MSGSTSSARSPVGRRSNRPPPDDVLLRESSSTEANAPVRSFRARPGRRAERPSHQQEEDGALHDVNDHLEVVVDTPRVAGARDTEVKVTGRKATVRAPMPPEEGRQPLNCPRSRPPEGLRSSSTGNVTLRFLTISDDACHSSTGQPNGRNAHGHRRATVSFSGENECRSFATSPLVETDACSKTAPLPLCQAG